MNSSSDVKPLTHSVVGSLWQRGRYAVLALLWLALAACSGGGGGGNANPSNLFSVGGEIRGLIGTIALRNVVDGNPGSILEFSNNNPLQTRTPFALPPRLSSGQSYNVVVVRQPEGQVCTVENATGTYRGSTVTDIVINCVHEGPHLTLTPRSAKIFHFTWDLEPGVTTYRLHEKPDAAGTYEPIASFGANENEYELEVFLPARISASYILEYCEGSNCKNSAPVFVSGTLREAIGYVKASNPGTNDEFGFSIALSEDGGTLAVGAPYEGSDASGEGDALANAGAVYVYTRTAPGNWEFQKMLKASDADGGDQFGHDVALSANGDMLAVGAPFEDSDGTGTGEGMANSGAVYVFGRTGEAWTEQQKLKAPNAGLGDQFGWSLSLSADGGTLAVGALFEDGNGADETDNSVTDSGAAYVFRQDGGVWSPQAYLKASNPGINDHFGHALALSADGGTLAVGAPLETSTARGIGGTDDDGASGAASGAVYVYRFDSDTDSWGAPLYIKATNADLGDQFGYSVALSADGGVLAAGAYREDSATTVINGDQFNNDARGSGAVYVYVRDEGGQWSHEAYLKASNAEGRLEGGIELGDEFGFAIAISGDGSLLAVGAFSEDSNATGIGGNQLNNGSSNSGAVYVFRRLDGEWMQQAYVKAPNTGASDVFGDDLALSGDGSTLAVGAPLEDGGATGVGGAMTNAVTNSGAVYLY
jgi:hypothetical protein